MSVHHSGLVSLSVGALSALAAGRRPGRRTPAVAADTPVAWVGGPAIDDDAHVVWTAFAGRRFVSHGALVADVGDRLFRRDLRRIGGAADVGFFQSFYRAYARELVRRLDGRLLRIGDGTAA